MSEVEVSSRRCDEGYHTWKIGRRDTNLNSAYTRPYVSDPPARLLA